MAETDQLSKSNKAKFFFRNQNWLRASMLLTLLLLAGYLIFASNPWDPDLDFSDSAKASTRVHSYVVDGLWWAALINLILIAISLFAYRFYPRSNLQDSNPNGASIDPASIVWKEQSTRQRRIILALSLLAVTLSAWLNAPLLNHSLWGDEEASARRFIIGHVKRHDDGSMKLHQPDWERTLWDYENGANNHILFSILARGSHGFAKPDEGPDDFYFSEFWIRLPSYLSGLGAVAAISWLMIVIGFPRAAPLASITLALHPWFVRWGTEARGYALELLFIPLSLIFLLKALRARPRSSSWWWGAYGITEFLLIYSHIGAVYFLVPLNIAAFVLVWKQSVKTGLPVNPFLQPKTWQLASANLLGAFFTILLMTPCIKPLSIWLGKDRARGDITWLWLEDWFSYFASGMPWAPWDASNPYCLTLPQFLSKHPLIGYSALLLTAMGLIAGTVAFLKNRKYCWLLLPLLTPGILTVLHAKIGGNLLYPWYMVGFLPLSTVVIAIGLDHVSRQIPFKSSFSIIATMYLAFFSLTTHIQRQWYRNHPVEALAESVRLTRTVVNPFHPDIDKVITLDIAHATRVYDPGHLKIRSYEALISALRQADSSNRPLYLNLGNPGLLDRDLPKIGKLIDDRNVFTAPTLIHGLQNPCTRYIFQYHPHSIDSIPPQKKL